MLHVCIAPLVSYDGAVPIFPEHRLDYIIAPLNPAVRSQRFSSWLLLQYAVENRLNLDFNRLEFEHDANGKWQCKSFCFSLAHTNHFAAAAISDSPVGIDIEAVHRFENNERSSGLYERIITANERTRFKIEQTALLWTGKEAAFKANNESVFAPNKINVLKQNIRWYNINGILLALCSKEEPKSLETVIIELADGLVKSHCVHTDPAENAAVVF